MLSKIISLFINLSVKKEKFINRASIFYSMAEEATVFGGVIDFITRLGFYDVLLPFLLTFTIVYAILDKTKVFGVEKIGEDKVGKRNLNSIVAFVMGLLVVFVKPLVRAIWCLLQSFLKKVRQSLNKAQDGTNSLCFSCSS
jgi:hypothetical protein